MEYVVMAGKLVSCWLVGENRRVGFLIGAVASAALTFIVYDSALYGVAVYEILACIIQLRAYYRRRHERA